jgi:cytoskeletal protein RodZ
MYWQPATRQEWYRLGLVAVALALVGAGALTVATTQAQAQTDLALDGLAVDDVNQTVDGEVSALTLTADVDYQHEVPDATRRVVRLKVGTSADDMETVAYRNHADADGTASGTVTLSGSVFDATTLSPADVTPPVAGSETTTLYVAAELELQRQNGETVTETATDTVTVTLHNGTSLTAEVGGTGTVTVETTG